MKQLSLFEKDKTKNSFTTTRFSQQEIDRLRKLGLIEKNTNKVNPDMLVSYMKVFLELKEY